jgi:predicted MFS family arabinose efflux permease
MVEILVPISISLGAFAMVVFLRRYENAERLKMIEHGMDPHSKKQKSKGTGLKFALVAIGVGLGLLVGSVLDASGIVYEEVAYFSMAFVFGGIGLLIGYLMEVKSIKEEEAREQGQN